MTEPELTPVRAYFEEARRALAEIALAERFTTVPDAETAGEVDSVDRFLYVQSVMDTTVARAENARAITTDLRDLEDSLPPWLARGTGMFWSLLPQIELGVGVVHPDKPEDVEPLGCPDAADLRDYLPALALAAQGLNRDVSGQFNGVTFAISPRMTEDEARHAWYAAHVAKHGPDER